jgi:hypothetical protein
VLNNRNEASCLFSKSIWDDIRGQHKGHIVVSAPKYNEIHYCTLESKALSDLIAYTIQQYNNAGNEALSPNIYLYHDSSWVMFDKGPGQVLDYCLEHKLK